ncbi:DUF3987 domain-containing protein [Streptomyces sp. TRM68367]|uniref:DUF3987 domain-containing protein n=1 Tax=Streptomyces sp. TRM68367 TaxID=2758415 RepID=UPI00165CA6D5|nr:DUF3987 domain-containing protein [Streptomyces sp. TRM68367]MBC9728468.1 DUF3987 domain-containing protein [Streptomyces sp. TRM68367]
MRPRNLSDRFWAAHEVLAEIRRTARARMVCPDSVLGVLLARTAGFLDPRHLYVDTGVDDRTSLNLIVANVGQPGISKSQSSALGRRLLPSREFPHVRLGNAGSGEGIAEAYMGEVETGKTTKAGKPITERSQVRHSAFLEADEGELIAKLGERSGSTLGATLRSTFTGAPLGQMNATKERQRDVRNYALGLALSFQPETLRPLLAEAAQGTPQRLLYLSAADPSMPPPARQEVAFGTAEPPAPTPSCQGLTERLVANVQAAIGVPASITFFPDVVYEVRTQRHLAHTEALPDQNPLDGHRTLLRLKVAALLTILLGDVKPGPNVVSERTWELSGELLDVSCNLRDALVEQARADERGRVEAGVQRHIDREVRTDHAKHVAKVERLAKRVRKHAAQAGAGGLPLSGRDGLPRRFDNRERGLLGEALDHAVNAGWIKTDQVRVYGGEVGELPPGASRAMRE